MTIRRFPAKSKLTKKMSALLLVLPVLTFAFVSCANSTIGGIDSDPFQGTWSGYYTDSAIVRLEFKTEKNIAIWKVTYEEYPRWHVRQGYYIYNENSAVLADRTGAYIGSSSVSGRNLTMAFEWDGWQPFTLTNENGVGTLRKQSVQRYLSAIDLVEQPWESPLCIGANVKMIEEYFFGVSNNWDYIFDRVSYSSPQGRTISSMRKVSFYLEKRNLYSSLVQFSDLYKILSYCDANQLPAIMNIQIDGNPLLGHSVLFAGYDSNNDCITIRDPENENRTEINYDDLLRRFGSVSIESELGMGNIMTIVSDRITDERGFFCAYCGKANYVDGAILDAITGLFCNMCENFIEVR